MTKRTAKTYKIMTSIRTETEYKAMMQRIDELLLIVEEGTPENDVNSIELVLLSNLVADYDEKHHPVSQPTLQDILKLRMYEMKLTQKNIAELLGVSPSRVSEYITGKHEPTLKVARQICVKLSVDAATVLGV